MLIGEKAFFTEHILKSNQETVEAVLAHTEQYYRTFQIPKAGGARTIQAVESGSELYLLQKALCRNFLNDIPLPTPAVGFVRDESYISFLYPHIGKRYYMRLDIKNFFGSITSKMITESFQEFFSEREPDILKWFTGLCTLGGRLPQGAVTSPAVSNVVFRRADQRILKYCQSFDVIYRGGRAIKDDVRYTRYADDLLFSSDCVDFSREGYFAGMIGKILKDSGFRLNPGKTKFGKDEISLSGYVISDNVHLSRRKLYSLNKLIYFFGKTDCYTDKKYRVQKALFQEPDWLYKVNQLALADSRGRAKVFQTEQEFLNYLCGYRSFLISVIQRNPEKDGSTRQLVNKTEKLERIIDCILARA